MSGRKISGNIVNLAERKIFPGTLTLWKNNILSITEDPDATYSKYILPGFIDSHVHIESSMVVPSEFARLAVVHGTVATVSDPHEIANVLGLEGVRYMIENAKQTPFKFFFGASPCVPATTFETAGGELTLDDISKLFGANGLKYMSEMMNYPGVINEDPSVMEKIELAEKLGRPVDGHSPGLSGEPLQKYIQSGISTDHESWSLEEAEEKIFYGMKIAIREGSAAKNFEALHSLISSYNIYTMLCSDDLHPDNLVEGHINLLVKRALAKGHDLMDVLYCACVNPIAHYGLNVGLVEVGFPGDFIVVDNLEELNVLETYIEGELVAQDGKCLFDSVPITPINNFNVQKKKEEEFVVPEKGHTIRVIEAIDGELVTQEGLYDPKVENGNVVPDLEQDILKLAVVNRYEDVPPAVGFIKNFGLKKGALASTVAHDSHNIIVVGTNDTDISAAVNALIDVKGGVVALSGDDKELLPLPVAGLMSDKDANHVGKQYSVVDKKAKEFGSTLSAPFMTLSFMALLVIPSLKLSDKGLFDGDKFEFVDLFPIMASTGKKSDA